MVRTEKTDREKHCRRVNNLAQWIFTTREQFENRLRNGFARRQKSYLYDDHFLFMEATSKAHLVLAVTFN